MALIVVSIDGVTDIELEKMASQPDIYPNIAKIKNEFMYRGGIRTILVSNTYPIHTTIATGKLPKDHGVISNFVHTEKGLRWAQLASHIKEKTIWDAARKQGLKVASILWPVTCGADIKWHMPEAHVHGNEKQIIENIRHGSKLFQLQAFFKYGKKLKGFTPVGLDDFSTSVAYDLLKKKRPDLTLIHLLAFDSLSHRHGSRSAEIGEAKKSLDISLGRILKAAEGMTDATILAFSDHGHFDVSQMVNLNQIFGENVYEQCGGCAFFKHANICGVSQQSQVPEFNQIENFPWFERFLTEQEMLESGYYKVAALGIAAKKGYCFSDEKQHNSNHGYPADYEDYNVFYAIKGKHTSNENQNIFKTAFLNGDIRDITELIKQILGLKM